MVWSPVLTPDDEPLKFEPPIVLVAATVVGVILPRVMVIAGVVVGFATEPETPFAVTTDTDVTVPDEITGVTHFNPVI
jgi:hypothetical protein